MKKAFPLVIAAIVFVIALVLLRPAPSRTVVTAAYDLRAGHVLQEEDLILMSVPDDVLAVDVITDKAMLIGQPLRIDRGQGDVIRASQLGNLIAVEANERAIAVHVTDASGVAGLLVPGQRVGVIASIPQDDTSTGDTIVSSAYTSDGVYPDGNVWVIDSGVGGDTEFETVDPTTGETVTGTFGETARVVKIAPDGTQTDVAMLPSVLVGEEAVGGGKLAYLDGEIYATSGVWLGDGAENPAPEAPNMAAVVKIGEDGTVEQVAPLWRLEKRMNPDNTIYECWRYYSY